MIVKATDIKNNFGKYLALLKEEDIIVTKNGTPVARITRQDDWDHIGGMCQQAKAYNYNGKRMSYDDFMEMYEKSTDRYEYIDGEVLLMTSPSITHQHIVGNLHVLFRNWFEGKKCMPFLSPFDITLSLGENNKNVVQPDLMVICDPENRNEKDRYMGIPSLVIEVLSDTTARMDLVKKLDLYMQSGVQEYWVVNCTNREVIVFLFRDKDIGDMKLFVNGGSVKSFIFNGLSVLVERIFMQ